MERLEDEADLVAPQAGAIVLGERAEVLTVEFDAPLGGGVQPREQPEERGLAAARGPRMATWPPASIANVIASRTRSSRPPET